MADFSGEFAAIVKAYEASGGEPTALFDHRSARLVVSHTRILDTHSIAGVRVEGEETPTGARARITVAPGAIVEFPVHLCFGIIPHEGVQEIVSVFEIGERANVQFLAHCSFPNALRVTHVMDGTVHVGKDATMVYAETHYHGEAGGIEVRPVVRMRVDDGGTLKSAFKLIIGAVGTLRLDYEADVQRNAVCEFDAKVYGKQHDNIVVKESLLLNGENARGLAKSRIVAADHCVSEVIGEAVGNAPNARGHVDCVEIIKGEHARVSAIPRLIVTDERAKLTHEAAIGSVDKKQVETLMARGLTEAEAVDVVVKGMLR